MYVIGKPPGSETLGQRAKAWNEKNAQKVRYGFCRPGKKEEDARHVTDGGPSGMMKTERIKNGGRRPGYELIPGYESTPRYELVPGSEQPPRSEQTPRYELIPRYEQVPGSEQAPRYELGPGYELIPGSEQTPGSEQAPRYKQAPGFEPAEKYHVPDHTFWERSCEGHGRHLGRSGRFFEDEGHRKHRWKLRRTTTHFNSQTTEWKLPTVMEGHMWRSLMVAAATHEYNPGEQHTSSRTTKVMVKVVTTEVTPTTRLVPRMVDSRKRREVELGVPCPRTEVARWSAEYSHWKTSTVWKRSLNYLEI